MPEGFHPQAWHDLFRKIDTLHRGGEYTTVGPYNMIAGCTNDTRPVSFKLERL